MAQETVDDFSVAELGALLGSWLRAFFILCFPLPLLLQHLPMHREFGFARPNAHTYRQLALILASNRFSTSTRPTEWYVFSSLA